MTILRKTLIGAGVALACGIGAMAYAAADYQAMIDGDIAAVLALAKAQPADAVADDATLAALPAPVRRYMAFAFQGEAPRLLRAAAVVQEGRFRRPGASAWEPMRAEQYVSAAAPAFVFTGTTQVIPGVTARAMDAYVDGRMRMRAKLFSAITVMSEEGGQLDTVSRMRFVIESALFPSALLPGEHLRWESIDDSRARAVVLAEGTPIGAYVVTVDADGAPATAGRFHGAGEVVARSDYRPVAGVMVPHRFTLSRRLDGEVQPFWTGEVTRIAFDRYEQF